MKKVQKGFGAVEALIVLVVIGLIVVAGWLVYDRQQDSQSEQQTETTQEVQESQEPAKQTNTLDPAELREASDISLLKHKGIELASSYLPKGWSTTEQCDESTAYVLPPEKDEVKCFTEDSGQMSFTVVDSANTIAPQNCDNEASLISEYEQYEWYVSYECDVVTINNRQAVKETTVQNELSAFMGAATITNYAFWLTDEKVVIVSFENIEEKNTPEYTEIFNQFVESIKFLEI